MDVALLLGLGPAASRMAMQCQDLGVEVDDPMQERGTSTVPKKEAVAGACRSGCLLGEVSRYHNSSRAWVRRDEGGRTRA